ncbi:MAG: metallopeptidase [Candidatus Aenigmatarchaeota archaeon]|nr:MAG: metallopeptidase [Candidatus Aenigmarchaeota archaeon]
MRFEKAEDIEARVHTLVNRLDLKHVDPFRIKCFRSHGSKARAYARIWSLPRVWQKALAVRPHYVIEVLSEHFDKQSFEEQTKTLIHELLHIPKTFSGATRPHAFFDKKIDRRAVEKYYALLSG